MDLSLFRRPAHLQTPCRERAEAAACANLGPLGPQPVVQIKNRIDAVVGGQQLPCKNIAMHPGTCAATDRILRHLLTARTQNPARCCLKVARREITAETGKSPLRYSDPASIVDITC